MIDKRVLMVLLLLLATRFVGGPTAAAQINREYELKAAYLYHFARLCTWRDGLETDPIVIGVLGPNRFGRQLARIERQSQNTVDTRVFRDMDSYRQGGDCRILFISGDGEEAERWLQQVLGRRDRTDPPPPLIFTENRAFAERDAAVNFYIRNNRLRLRINLEAVRRAGATIPASLLDLASVERYQPEETGR